MSEVKTYIIKNDNLEVHVLNYGATVDKIYCKDADGNMENVLLSYNKKEDYMHYIKRVAENPIAREVKKCDLMHNMDLSRLETVTEKDIARKEKYQKAYKYIVEREDLFNDIQH